MLWMILQFKQYHKYICPMKYSYQSYLIAVISTLISAVISTVISTVMN